MLCGILALCMSAWTFQRRLYISLTLLVVLVFSVSGILFVFFYNPPPVPTCSDGVQNGLEEGRDCGGGCPNACPRKLLDLWTRPFPLAKGLYSAVAYVENQNERLYVRDVQFEIVLYDANNKSIDRTSCRTPIMPNGVTAVFVPYIPTYEREATSATFRFAEEPVFSQYSDSLPNFTFSDIEIAVFERGDPSVSVLATNAGEQSADEVDFVVILYDEDDVAVASSRTFERFFAPGESRRLQFTWVHPIVLRKGACPGGLCIRQVKRAEIIPVLFPDTSCYGTR